MQLSVEVAVVPSVMLVGFRPQARAVCETLAVRLTVPVKLLSAVTLIVEVRDELTFTVTVPGLAVILKPLLPVDGAFTWTVNFAV